jgi:hypothetical protein
MGEVVLPARFDEDLVEAILELLDAYGLRARVGYLEPATMREPMLASVIPFVGSGLKGSLMLATTRAVIAATHATTWDEARLRDWIGELGTQALGCIRRKLQSRGIHAVMGLPAVLGAVHLDLRAIDERYTRAHAFDTPIGTIMVSLDVVALDPSIAPWTESGRPVSDDELSF